MQLKKILTKLSNLIFSTLIKKLINYKRYQQKDNAFLFELFKFNC